MHYAVGDVHGCFDELMNLIDKIEAVDPDAVFIFLGDFPDRGPKTRETLKWVLENITGNGKNQSVRGNHEQSVIDWYHDEYRTAYQDMTEYISGTYCDDENELKSIVDLFEHLPFNRRIEITLKNGNIVPYRICHAAHRAGLSEKEQKGVNLKELDYWGRGDTNEITVCGHTPTIDRDFWLRGSGEDMPGFICYRNRMINIDCGRCYPYENKGITFLAAICLETLEEYYDASVEERIQEYAKSEATDWMRQMGKKRGMTDIDEINTVIASGNLEGYIEKYGKSTVSYYRKRIIDEFGFPPDIPFELVRIKYEQ